MKLSERLQKDFEVPLLMLQEIMLLEEELDKANSTLRAKRDLDNQLYQHDLVDAIFDISALNVDHDAIDRACISRLYNRRVR